MFCAIIAYFAMNNATLGYLMFAFPELLLVVLALTMLLGRYNHYKLTEYKEKGPMVLEANARPGIAIQIANRCGLITRTEKVDAVDISKFTLRQRVEFALNAYK